MNKFGTFDRSGFLPMLAVVTIALAGFSNLTFADELKITLSGDQEVPPVKTAATGNAGITINADMTVTGSITTTGVAGTMAHIHQGAAGTNGPVIIPFTKNSDGAWTIPAGAKMTEAQYQTYRAGGLYINVHSAENKSGEIRGQLKP